MCRDSWATGWTTQSKEDDWEDEYLSTDMSLETISPNAIIRDFGSKIDIPEWCDIDKGYKPVNAEKLGDAKGDFAVVVTYSPNVTLGIGYKRVFIVEKSTQKPFPRMKEMWDELRNRSLAKSQNKTSTRPHVFITPYANTGFAKGDAIPDNITIYDNGELRSAFGVPKTMEIYGIVVELSSIYNDWRLFPNETNYTNIEKLKDAKYRVRNMHLRVSDFEREINESRNIIKEQQDRIANLEETMNKIYEEGADAMNLLEEHGVEIDGNGNIKEDTNGESTMELPLLSGMLGDLVITYDPGSLSSCSKITSDDIYYTSSN